MKSSIASLLLIMYALASQAQDCKSIMRSSLYFSASATGTSEKEAQMNALAMLAENISSVVSSRTDMLTGDDGQKFSSISKSSSVLRLQNVGYTICDKSRKGFSVTAFISKKDLEKTAAEVAVRVQQYVELMEQKQAEGTGCLAEAYTAYIYTFSSPYPISYTSQRSRITNVQSYLGSYLRNYLSNVSIRCTKVKENAAYPDRQLTLMLAVHGTNTAGIKFELSLPEYNAQATLDSANSSIDVIMKPDSRTTKFRGTFSLTAPQLGADLEDIGDQVHVSRDVVLDADMSEVIHIDFTAQHTTNSLLMTPVVRHLSVRTMEWLSGSTLLSTEEMPRLSADLKEVTLRINGSNELMITKVFDNNLAALQSTIVNTNLGRSMEMREFIVSELSGPPMRMAQPVDAAFASDAMMLVYTDIKDVVFRSSMPAIDKQSYNYEAERYEVLVKPVKQIFFAGAEGIVEKDMGVINPQPNQAISFRLRAVPFGSRHDRGSDPLAYLNGRAERRYFQDVDTDPAETARVQLVNSQQRRLTILKRKATLNYSMGVMGIGFGLYYRWLGNIINDGTSSAGHSNTFDVMSNVCYVAGGAAIVMGIIRSAQVSHLRKKWDVVPTPNINGAGITVTYKF
jgi:hypothetical protein